MDDLNREVLRAELTIDEGERLRVYFDTVGKRTVGVGRNLDAARKGPKGTLGISARETEVLGITRDSVIRNGITKAQSQALLDNDIENVFDDLDRFLPWWRDLDPVRQRVLANMCFNMGITTLRTFRNTLRYVREGNYASAADNMLASKWARQVKGRADRLAVLMRLGPRKL